MPQHKIRNARIPLFRALPKLLNVTCHAPVAIRLMEKSIIFFRKNRFSMTQMIIPRYIPSLFRKPCGKSVISIDIFHHPVTDLQHCLHFLLRHPFYCMDAGLPVRRGVIKFLFHLPFFHPYIIPVRCQRFVCRTDNLIYIDQLFQSVGAPSYDTGSRKDWCVQS